MTAHEPQCVQWKRQGAERLAEQLAGLSTEQELAFWQAQTTRLKFLQGEAKKHPGYGLACHQPQNVNMVNNLFIQA